MSNKIRSLPPVLQLMRPHQWVKNLLLFMPIVFAHRISETGALLNTCLAAVLFSLTASAVYVMNDYLDVEADKEHPRKKHRPFAAGSVPLRAAFPLTAGLIAVSSAGALLMNRSFALLLLLYFSANLFYSSFLKQVPVWDVVFLTLMFLTRIYAGGLASGIPVSFWLFTFCLFFFLSLAFSKRVQELQVAAENRVPVHRLIRGYTIKDLPCISQLGIASGVLSILVLAMYINSADMVRKYSRPEILWLMCPLTLSWISRLWLITMRGEMLYDPVLFALKDRTGIFIFLVLMGVVQAAYWL